MSLRHGREAIPGCKRVGRNLGEAEKFFALNGTRVVLEVFSKYLPHPTNH